MKKAYDEDSLVTINEPITSIALQESDLIWLMKFLQTIMRCWLLLIIKWSLH